MDDQFVYLVGGRFWNGFDDQGHLLTTQFQAGAHRFSDQGLGAYLAGLEMPRATYLRALILSGAMVARLARVQN